MYLSIAGWIPAPSDFQERSLIVCLSLPRALFRSLKNVVALSIRAFLFIDSYLVVPGAVRLIFSCMVSKFCSYLLCCIIEDSQ